MWLTVSSLKETLKNALLVDREEALRAFKLGVLSLEERAMVDMLFDATCNRILHMAAAAKLPLPEALQPSTRPHSATYHVNLSSESDIATGTYSWSSTDSVIQLLLVNL